MAVETLGTKRASGSSAKLKVVELRGRKYRVEEHDGWESVKQPDDAGNWEVIPKGYRQ